ncbi:MAG: hypothetical protein DHS20C13_08030 [Thermodesulfobacteriota bacterium]|nr:MAG: hypothetical protein DHS20C13_08030 [Thermodesulfobacteriota bacterium]
MKCVLCDKRKPKRYCPAKRTSICPVCCGEKRGVEINCPLDCQYYVEGLKQHQQKMMQQRIKKKGAGSYVRKTELYKHNPELFAHLEKGFVSIFRADKNLTNKDLVTGLDLAMKTLETEKKGLLYQHQSGNNYADEISNHTLNIVNEYKDNAELGANRISLDFGIKVVKEFLDEATFYMENDVNPKSYLVHLMRYHPEEEAPAQAESKLIIMP